MSRSAVSAIMMSLLVLGTLALAFNVQPVKSDYAWTETIYIRADGSIHPPTAPISSVDNVTYTLTDNIAGNVTASSSAIIIQRDNITIEGAGHTLQGILASGSEGINMTGRNNVTIKNMKITVFVWGIYLSSSSSNSVSGNNIANNGEGIGLVSSSNNNSVSGNNITANNGYGIFLSSSSSNSVSGNNITANNGCGIYLYYSSNNGVSGNNITNNGWGLYLYSCSNNSVSGNNIKNDGYGIGLDLTSSGNIISGNKITANNVDGILLETSSSDNIISENNITNNGNGIVLDYSSSNTIYHDNFINNTSQVYSLGSTNVWDDGYPSGGNYWSDYNGTDLFRGANQNVNGSDGIGDSTYSIGANNTDHYPLMGLYGSTVNTGSNVTVYPSQDIRLIFQNVTAAGTVVLNKTLTVKAPALTNLTGEYYDIKVTASYAGSVTVIVTFDGSNLTQQQKGNLQMMQYTPTPGDVVAPFGLVDIRDISYIARRFGTHSDSPNWDSSADITGPQYLVPDGKVDIRDLSLVARNFGKTANWVNITTYVDTANNVIYGQTTHFSFIGIH